MGQPAACMIENNRGLSTRSVKWTGIFGSRDYGRKLAPRNATTPLWRSGRNPAADSRLLHRSCG